MPKRQSTLQIISTEMQGSDSWIKIIPPTMEQMKDYRNSIRPMQERLEQLRAEGKKETAIEIQQVNDEIGEAGKVLIAQYVSKWNWVDNDDNPLPQPSEPGAVDKLNMREIKWIMRQFQFDEAEKKG